MPQIEIDSYSTVIRSLPEIAKQLEIANKLKAIEIKLKFHAGVQNPPPAWAEEIDRLVK